MSSHFFPGFRLHYAGAKWACRVANDSEIILRLATDRSDGWVEVCGERPPSAAPLTLSIFPQL